MKRFLQYCLFILIFATPNLLAQFYETGQDPASIKWRQITSPHFRIIYPSEISRDAQHLANTLEYVYGPMAKSLKHEPRNISILLHNRSLKSNAYVVWAPKRMEIYTTPPQDMYPQLWTEQIALHELRHVVQIDKLNSSFGHILSLIFGEQGVGSLAGMVPQWFFEGDAVYTETAFSTTGRGRMPSFEMRLRAITLEKNTQYSYPKTLLGSYRDFVPDYYEYGYQMVSYGRIKYGNLIWEKPLRNVARAPFIASPFTLSMIHNMGHTKRSFYLEAFDSLKIKWNIQNDSVHPEKYISLNTNPKKYYTTLRFPQYLDNSHTLAFKSNIDDIDRFIVIDSLGNEKRLFTPGSFDRTCISYAAGKLVWCEYQYDLRWEEQNFYAIRMLDIQSGKTKEISKRSRYFAPAIDSSGKYVAAIEIDISNRCAIVILNADNGTILSKKLFGYDTVLQLPSWNKSSTSIIFTAVLASGKGIFQYNIHSNTLKAVIEPSLNDVSFPIYYKNYILYKADYSGIDNIYAIDTLTKNIWCITNAKYGASDPTVSPDGKILLFADYSVKGYNVAKLIIDTNSWIELPRVKNYSLQLSNTIAKQENFVLKHENIPQDTFIDRSYKRFPHLLHFHSWSPFYYNYDFTSVNNPLLFPGITFLTQNTLGSSTGSIALAYKNRLVSLNTKYTMSGLYPVIEFNTESNTFSDAFYTRIYQPLNFKKNKYFRTFIPILHTRLSNSSRFNDKSTKTPHFNYLRYQLYFSNYLKYSYRDIKPRFGQVIDISFLHNAFNSSVKNSTFIADINLYLPGIGRHHTFALRGAWQTQYGKSIVYNTLQVSRTIHFQDFFFDKISCFAADYFMPLFYPDLNFRSWFYIKRVQANLFFELNNFNKIYYNGNYYGYKPIMYKPIRYKQIAGIDVTADYHLLNFIFPFNTGIRLEYFPLSDNYFAQVLFRIALNP